MPLSPADFFDRPDVYARYRMQRDDPTGPALTIERPIVLDFLGSVQDRAVIDLGCGNAAIGRDMLACGAKHYLGLDVSSALLAEARSVLAGTTGEVRLLDLERLGETGNIGLFDIAVSRLALQYVRDVGSVFEATHDHLRPGGLFVFSVEHPILTSICDRPEGPIGGGWPVAGYFCEGKRTARWLGTTVQKHHRTLDTYIAEVLRHGFRIDRFSEGRPAPENFATGDVYQARCDVPMCAVFRCVRDSSA